jgi:hypothetical protein
VTNKDSTMIATIMPLVVAIVTLVLLDFATPHVGVDDQTIVDDTSDG